MNQTIISEQFAKDVLAACYKVDVIMRDLENLSKKPESPDLGVRVTELLDLVTTTLGANILVPIYQQHPALGTVMEPGDWYAGRKTPGRILFRKSSDPE